MFASSLFFSSLLVSCRQATEEQRERLKLIPSLHNGLLWHYCMWLGCWECAEETGMHDRRSVSYCAAHLEEEEVEADVSSI